MASIRWRRIWVARMFSRVTRTIAKPAAVLAQIAGPIIAARKLATTVSIKVNAKARRARAFKRIFSPAFSGKFGFGLEGGFDWNVRIVIFMNSLVLHIRL